MSDLSSIEKRKLERLFGMGSGYVLNFSDRTFGEFFEEHTGRDIDHVQYRIGSGPKATLGQRSVTGQKRSFAELRPLE
jgi:hypothetical protein